MCKFKVGDYVRPTNGWEKHYGPDTRMKITAVHAGWYEVEWLTVNRFGESRWEGRDWGEPNLAPLSPFESLVYETLGPEKF